jgi:5-methylcytosine-specific restriction endonuclease McrA
VTERRAERFLPEATGDDLRREKLQARALRQTAWWKRRIASGQCHYCRRQVGPRALTMDHVVPIVRGGRSIRANLVPCCRDCNARKQSLLPFEWTAYLEGFPDDAENLFPPPEP